MDGNEEAVKSLRFRCNGDDFFSGKISGDTTFSFYDEISYLKCTNQIFNSLTGQYGKYGKNNDNIWLSLNTTCGAIISNEPDSSSLNILTLLVVFVFIILFLMVIIY